LALSDKLKKCVPLNNKIFLPEKSSVVFKRSQFIVSGPLGTLYLNTKKLKRMPQQVPQAKKLIYSYQSALRIAVQGVCYGHVEKLKLEGSGYKVMKCKPLKIRRTLRFLKKDMSKGVNYRMVPVLKIRLGYSNISQFRIPSGVKASFNRFGQILFTSASRAKLLALTTKIQRTREPNAYRYKGVYKVGPVKNRKPLKTAGKKN
jgi:ribosomal protein L6P/L9E